MKGDPSREMIIWGRYTKYTCFSGFGVNSSSKRLLPHWVIKCWIISNNENESDMVVWLMSSHPLSEHRTTYCLQSPWSSSSSKLWTLPAWQGSGSSSVSWSSSYLFLVLTLKSFFPLLCACVMSGCVQGDWLERGNVPDLFPLCHLRKWFRFPFGEFLRVIFIQLWLIFCFCVIFLDLKTHTNGILYTHTYTQVFVIVVVTKTH